jgi:flavin reductase (DIM6/NTAB) family NADH-FMN oxidoreductase RutF
MKISPKDLGAESLYKLLTGSVVPRPIAWITTKSVAGFINVAPFSAFTFVSNKPPMVAVSIGKKKGVLKDTARNIIDLREYVVNIADSDAIEQLHMSAEECPPDVSEADKLGIELEESEQVLVPRIRTAPISFECRLVQMLQFGDFATNLFIGEIVLFHVRDGLLQDGKIDTLKLRPICRLGGPNYASLGSIVSMKPIKVTAK